MDTSLLKFIAPFVRKREKSASLRQLCLSEIQYAKKVGCHPKEALIHYENIGWKEGANPHVLFDTKYVLSQYADGQPFKSPFELYERAAKKSLITATPFFILTWYAEQNPDVMAAGVDPFLHYIQHGAKEGRQPNPWYQLPPFDHPPKAVFNNYEHLDDYLERDVAKIVDRNWISEIFDVPLQHAHTEFWRMRASGLQGWPFSHERLFGSVHDLTSDLGQFRSILAGIIENDSRS